jgi:hypothetical protein
VDRLEKKFADLPPTPAGTPETEVSVTALMDELTEIQQYNAGVTVLVNREKEWDSALEAGKQTLSDLRERIADLNRQADAKEELNSALEKQLADLRAEIEKTPAKDEAPVREKIQGADAINQAVRNRLARKAAEKEWYDAKADAEKLTADIEACDKQKAEMLAAAEFPVEGLTFDDGGLYLNGVPFSECSTSEQLKVSIPLAFASSPLCRFAIIRDGSLLDADSMALVAELAEKEGAQLLIERVTEDPTECSVLFVDGAIAEAN